MARRTSVAQWLVRVPIVQTLIAVACTILLSAAAALSSPVGAWLFAVVASLGAAWTLVLVVLHGHVYFVTGALVARQPLLRLVDVALAFVVYWTGIGVALQLFVPHTFFADVLHTRSADNIAALWTHMLYNVVLMLLLGDIPYEPAHIVSELWSLVGIVVAYFFTVVFISAAIAQHVGTRLQTLATTPASVDVALPMRIDTPPGARGRLVY